MRKLSLKDGVINNKKVDYNLYGALQEMSYLKERTDRRACFQKWQKKTEK